MHTASNACGLQLHIRSHNMEYRKDLCAKILTMLAIAACTNLLALAEEKVCSSFCSSLGMAQTNPGKSCDDIYQINKASRGVSRNY